MIFHSSLFTLHFAEGDLSVFCVRDPTPFPSPWRGGEWEVVPYSTAELPEKTRQHFDTQREGIAETAQDIFKYCVECWTTLHFVLTFAPCRISRLFMPNFGENYAEFVYTEQSNGTFITSSAKTRLCKSLIINSD